MIYQQDSHALCLGQSVKAITARSRKSACDQRCYHGINPFIQCVGAIDTASKILWKGLKLTCNLTGQRVSENEGNESLRRMGRGVNGNTGVRASYSYIVCLCVK